MTQRVTIVRPGVPAPPPAAGERVVAYDDFVAWVRRGSILTNVGRFADGRLLVWRVEAAGRPLPVGLALRALSRGEVAIEDVRGSRCRLTARLLARWIAQAATEPFRVGSLLRRVDREVRSLEAASAPSRAPGSRLDLSRSPLYLRTDLSFGVRAGGSVAHIAGVVNELGGFTGPVTLLTTDDIPLLKPSVRVRFVHPSESFWNFKELPTFLLNDAFAEAIDRSEDPAPAFVYQRYSLNNYSGLAAARRLGVPFVLEYNGSELWVGRHWGNRIRYEDLSARIERLNLSAADLVVVVSQPLADEVARTGVDPRRILVNPNGVDPEQYRPDIDGSRVRAGFGWDREIVVGFIGTFGPWHGAEVLARAFVALHRDERRQARIRLLMIGDGARLPAVRQIVDEGKAADAVAFTGLIPQERGPEYLAACDILVAPHVRNPDGTPFFESPTKLFEYMAMGRGIVASDLDQIGEVVEHGRTGWLVPPEDVGALAAGIDRLAADADLRARLGAAARARALERHTWRAHTARTIETLQDVWNGRG